ncbi:MAG: type II toxin-antitoxin system RelE/ParE family toxin [Alphaproteobacteria bacterium]|nr:type II toxin-antitoxin system RelE/ParE family toxin [Alphaproteobacteria bacterium]
MEVRYHIRYLEIVLKKHIPALPPSVTTFIQKAIEERLMVDPIGLGKPLRYSLKGHRRLRAGNYRIVYRIDAKTSTVTIIAIKHRKNIYEG